MPTITDPITQGYTDIINALKACTAFAGSGGIVKLGNLKDFSDGTLRQLLAEVQAGNLPEVVLLQGAFSLSPYGSNSKTADLSQTYSLVTTTDTMQVATINQVKFATLAALYKSNLENGTFNGKPYIRGWSIGGGSDGSSGVKLPTIDTSASRGTWRLCDILNITVQMFVAKSDLPA